MDCFRNWNLDLHWCRPQRNLHLHLFVLKKQDMLYTKTVALDTEGTLVH